MNSSPKDATGGAPPARRRWTFASAVLDERSLELHVAGRRIELERKPLEVLLYLLNRADQVVTKDELVKALWPGRIVSDSVLAKSVGKLREALADDAQAIVKTVHGYGYRLVAPVRADSPAAPPAPGTSAALRILLIEDHELFRAGIKLLLTDLAETIEFAEARDCATAFALAAAGGKFDIVLLDFHLPGLQGLDALRAVRARLDEAIIVVLSAEEDPTLIRRIVEEGAAGFIPKASTHAVMLAALRLVLAGGSYLPPNALLGMNQPPPGISAKLTPAQISILRLALQGKPSDVIARELKLTEPAVKDGLAACFGALGVNNRADAVFAAARAALRT